ncbi:MAG: response regulator, partial [Desulfobaccales bacterium]
IRQSGGSIEVYSEVGRGTTFKVYLSMVGGKAETVDRPEQIIDLARGTETILVVEDEDMVRQFTVKILDRLGYLVLGASNGEEALQLAEGHEGRIDLLMTDVVMPGMNGRQLADELTRIRPGTAVLFTSGYTESIIVNQGVVEKSLNFIGKPYSPQAIAKKIRELLDMKRS